MIIKRTDASTTTDIDHETRRALNDDDEESDAQPVAK